MKSFEHDYLLEVPLTHQLLMAVRAVGEYRGRQQLYVQQAPEVLETLRQMAMIQSAESSNRIEGITVAAERLEPLLRRQAKPQDRPEQEVVGYRDVLADIHANHAKIRLTPELLRQWHRRMYSYTAEPAGEWKKADNAIYEVNADGRQRIRFRPVSAAATPEYMRQLISGYERALAEKKADPLLVIAATVFDFECVHPFMDGNGRIGRLLTLLLLYQHGYEVGRYIGLERIVEESKVSYYDALQRSSLGWFKQEHDLRPWWHYFCGMLTAACKEFEERVGTVTSARGAKRAMVVSAIGRLHGTFTIAELQRACPGVSYPTLQRALFELKKKRKIRCLGRGVTARWERIGD